MELDANVTDVIDWLEDVLGESEQAEEGCYTFSLFSRGARSGYRPGGKAQEYVAEVHASDVEQLLRQLASKTSADDIVLYDTRSFELLVQAESSRFIPRGLHTPIALTDTVNGLNYQLSEPTDEYTLFLLYGISKLEYADFRYTFGSHRLHEPRNAVSQPPRFTLSELLQLLSRRFLTVRIESEIDHSLKEFRSYADSMLFQLGYNLDLAIVPLRSLDEVVKRERLRRLRRSTRTELEAPKRQYARDLIYHYQLAIASDSSPLQFLSYYHIAEHFFEEVFEDALIENVRETITQPAFSYRKTEDIRRLIKAIKDSVKVTHDEVSFNEKEALQLTLRRYVNVPQLGQQILDYDRELADYYKREVVSFCKGPAVDLWHEDESSVLKKLTDRIYRTRNAIVHSKDILGARGGARGRFIPFTHDRILAKEIPLIRFIAEAIIINTSSLM